MRQIVGGQCEGGKIHIEVNIAIDQEERFRSEQRQGVQQSAAGFQPRCTFKRIGDRNAKIGAVAQCRRKLLGQPRGIDHDVADAGFGQRFTQFAKNAAGFEGTLTARNEGLQAALKNNQNRQDRMSDRLGQYEARLLKQYSALDATMAQMNSMANYVTQQLAALTQNNKN